MISRNDERIEYQERLLKTPTSEIGSCGELEDKLEAIKNRPYKVDEQGLHYSSDQLAAMDEVSAALESMRYHK